MSSIDTLGYSAALAVLVSFCMSSILPLRIVAIISNVLFALYGLLDHLYPIFLLHSILLPINIFKLTLLKLRRSGRHHTAPTTVNTTTVK
jgi:CRP/FNR family cyclic AMP-dependent transcriptional regulator